jgi:hypothetical protein
MCPILPKFTLPPHGNLRIYYVILKKLKFTLAAHHLLKTVKTQAGREPATPKTQALHSTTAPHFHMRKEQNFDIKISFLAIEKGKSI